MHADVHYTHTHTHKGVKGIVAQRTFADTQQDTDLKNCKHGHKSRRRLPLLCVLVCGSVASSCCAGVSEVRLHMCPYDRIFYFWAKIVGVACVCLRAAAELKCLLKSVLNRSKLLRSCPLNKTGRPYLRDNNKVPLYQPGSANEEKEACLGT